MVVIIVKRGHLWLNITVGSIVRLGIIYKYIKRIGSLPLSLKRVLSIFFKIVLVVIIRIPLLELVVARNYWTLGDVGHLVMEYVTCF